MRFILAVLLLFSLSFNVGNAVRLMPLNVLGRFQSPGHESSSTTLMNKLLSIRGGMELRIKPASGRTFTLPVEPDESIESIKARIMEREGIPVDQQRIVFGGKQLDSLKSLSDYDIDEDSTLHLTLRLRGGI